MDEQVESQDVVIADLNRKIEQLTQDLRIARVAVQGATEALEKEKNLVKSLTVQRDRFINDLTDSQCEALEVANMLTKEREETEKRIEKLRREFDLNVGKANESAFQASNDKDTALKEMQEAHSLAYTKEYNRRMELQERVKVLSDYIARMQKGGKEFEGFPLFKTATELHSFYKELRDVEAAKPAKRKAPVKRKQS